MFQLAGVIALSSAMAHAAVFTFDTNPFEGSDALTTPGRQIVGNEQFIDFNVATDVFELSRSAFGVDSLSFINDESSNLPASGVNVVVLQNFEVPMAAGIAATLIADQITEAGPGFFIYFNSNLDVPRLVFSTDLSSPDADLKILYRLNNLVGQDGRDTMPSFTASNFEAVPDGGSSLATLAMAGGLLLAGRVGSQRLRRN